jgi:putative ABC transport system ATP-binding protein
MDPSIIFADEPTGSLDEERAKDVEDLLLSLVKERGCTLLLVTHDMDFAKRCDTVLELTYRNIIPLGACNE